MSYLFDGLNDALTGTFDSSYADPVTLACYTKVTDHPAANKSLVMLGNSSSSTNDSYNIKASITDNVWTAVSRDTANGSALSPATVLDAVWIPVVGVFASNTLRDIYVSTPSITGQDTVSRAPADVLKHIRLGEDLAGVQDFLGRIAEVAIWKKALSAGEIASYMNGLSATRIAPDDLIGYWPLSYSNATQTNQGRDTGGALTVTSAVFDADHPFIHGGDLPAWVSYSRVWRFRTVRRAFLTTTAFKNAVVAEARGAAVWAREAPGSVARSGSSNLQVNVRLIPGVVALRDDGHPFGVSGLPEF